MMPFQDLGPGNTTFQAQLRARGIDVHDLNEQQFLTMGGIRFRARTKRGLATGRAVRIDQVDAALSENTLKHMSLVHPHMVAPTMLMRAGDYVCILTPESSGGSLFAMVRRSGEGGLAETAAAFLAAQLAAAAEFLHAEDVYLHELSPASLQVKWSGGGVPLVMVHPFQLASESVATTGNVAIYTPPHVVRLVAEQASGRASAAPGVPPAAANAFKVACDVWAIAVALFFLLYGRFPFTQAQIRAWAAQPTALWCSHEGIDYSKPFGAEVAPEIVAWLKRVFAAGRMPAARFAERFGSMDVLFEQTWLAQATPRGARTMAAKWAAETRTRRASPEFQNLVARVHAAAERAPAAADHLESAHSVVRAAARLEGGCAREANEATPPRVCKPLA